MSNEGIGDDGSIPGSCVHRYLTEYATKFGLVGRLRLESGVQNVTRTEDGALWNLQLANNKGSLICEKIIVATGLTSQPYIPAIPNQGYEGEILHTKELGKSETVQRIDTLAVKRVLVHGGSKSAFDAVYLLLRAGKYVEWVVRNGNGPSIMTPITVLGSPSFHLSNSRFLGMFSPNVFDMSSVSHRLLHGVGSTQLARRFVTGFWKIMTFLLERPARYSRTENGRALKPNMGLER
jgi:dimethylaniline monooxygenase (N-oxide forming)